MNYVEEDPIDEVYRTRFALLEEHGGIKGYFRHLDAVRPKWEAMGFKCIGEQSSL
ncbi:MAG: hypothetical protein LBU89_01450 [Fibromonadaceae bacterium]|jgi:hypothetical protein|nr:hypothetical protein [Fibromonadaceae bacterium]